MNHGVLKSIRNALENAWFTSEPRVGGSNPSGCIFFLVQSHRQSSGRGFLSTCFLQSQMMADRPSTDDRRDIWFLSEPIMALTADAVRTDTTRSVESGHNIPGLEWLNANSNASPGIRWCSPTTSRCQKRRQHCRIGGVERLGKDSLSAKPLSIPTRLGTRARLGSQTHLDSLRSGSRAGSRPEVKA